MEQSNFFSSIFKKATYRSRYYIELAARYNSPEILFRIINPDLSVLKVLKTDAAFDLPNDLDFFMTTQQVIVKMTELLMVFENPVVPYHSILYFRLEHNAKMEVHSLNDDMVMIRIQYHPNDYNFSESRRKISDMFLPVNSGMHENIPVLLDKDSTMVLFREELYNSISYIKQISKNELRILLGIKSENQIEK